jgi:hypothetical protein
MWRGLLVLVCFNLQSADGSFWSSLTDLSEVLTNSTMPHAATKSLSRRKIPRDQPRTAWEKKKMNDADDGHVNWWAPVEATSKGYDNFNRTESWEWLKDRASSLGSTLSSLANTSYNSAAHKYETFNSTAAWDSTKVQSSKLASALRSKVIATKEEPPPKSTKPDRPSGPKEINSPGVWFAAVGCVAAAGLLAISTSDAPHHSEVEMQMQIAAPAPSSPTLRDEVDTHYEPIIDTTDFEGI